MMLLLQILIQIILLKSKLYHYLCINFHEDTLNNLPIIPWNRSFLGDLESLGSLPGNKENISFFEHNKSCSYGIFTGWNYPELFSFFSTNSLGNITNDTKGILRISIIISKYDGIRKNIDYSSHFWTFCFIPFSCCSKYSNDSFRSFYLTYGFKNAL